MYNKKKADVPPKQGVDQKDDVPPKQTVDSSQEQKKENVGASRDFTAELKELENKLKESTKLNEEAQKKIVLLESEKQNVDQQRTERITNLQREVAELTQQKKSQRRKDRRITK